MDSSDEVAYRDFVRSRRAALLRTAFLLCGDPGHAEDLLQNAFLGLYRTWPLRSGEAADAYVRRSLCNGRTSRWRRRSSHERPAADLPDSAGPDEMAAVDTRDLVLRALSTLAPRQRAVIVLRFYADLAEAETAAALGCSVGTVKSQTSDALARLRLYEALATSRRTAGERA
jgi:RNA polymerase sigma-70 factor (sigma-E family)